MKLLYNSSEFNLSVLSFCICFCLCALGAVSILVYLEQQKSSKGEKVNAELTPSQKTTAQFSKAA